MKIVHTLAAPLLAGLAVAVPALVTAQEPVAAPAPDS